eukprot:gb/GECG01005994.1/.p1 GENE.gb/GECG01005994.1/~~gb/GECG01005994.1/.p1  ORF type:complete len:458 (+),score=61.15 gb/GECG01005994.1/:1-1374(+)
MVVVQYIIQLPNQGTTREEEIDGCFQVPGRRPKTTKPDANKQQQASPPPQGRITLKDLKDNFPFEGQFHFRARIYTQKQKQLVWLDLCRDGETVPLSGENHALIKVLPLYEVEDDSQGNVESFPYTPEEWKAARRHLNKIINTSVGMQDGKTILRNDETPDAGQPFGVEETNNSRASRSGSAVHSVQDTAKHAWQTVSKRVDTDKIRAASSSAFKALSGAWKRASDYVRSSVEGDQQASAVAGQEAGDYPSDLALTNLHDIHTDFNTQFKPEFTPHEALLEALWENLLPDEEFTRVSPQWQLLGFQQEDPSYDFRGGGILGLKCLVYMAREHTTQTRSILFTGDQTRHLPFALASINLTAALAKALGIAHFTKSIDRQKRSYWPLFEHNSAFHELHFIALLALYQEWADNAYEVNSSNFPKALASISKKVEKWLSRAPLTLEDLQAVAKEKDNVEAL